MNWKNIFFTKVILFILILSAVIFAQDTCDCEVRGAWVNPQGYYSQEKRDETLKNLLAANINTLVLTAPQINDNYGWGDPDDFLAFVTAAKDSGLSVHPWIECMFRMSSDSVNFADPLEQEAQKQWVLDLLSAYGNFIDGVSLDYLRIPSWGNVNINGQMEGINTTIAGMKEAIELNYPEKFLTASPFTLQPSYADFSSEEIPDWFLTWFNNNPGNPYDVVSPYFDTVPNQMKFQQDAVSWITLGNVDAIMPMQYALSDSIWNAEADQYLEFLGENRKKVYIGLGWLEEEGHPEWGYDAAGIIRKIKYGRSLGYTGWIIYKLGADSVDDLPLIEALTVDSEINNFDAPFKNKIRSCFKTDVSKIDDEKSSIEKEFHLFQNYPNPFNPTSTIMFSIHAVETPYMASLPHVTLKIYNMLGREVAELVNEFKNPGMYKIKFNAGDRLASGHYIYRLSCGSYSESKLMLLLK
ncbi:MAG: hypothetical protein V1720_05680 [bacterium]